MDGNRPISSSSSLLNARDLSRSNKDYLNSQHTSTQFNSGDPSIKKDDATISSLLILKHPNEEPQVCNFLYYHYNYFLHYGSSSSHRNSSSKLFVYWSSLSFFLKFWFLDNNYTL